MKTKLLKDYLCDRTPAANPSNVGDAETSCWERNFKDPRAFVRKALPIAIIALGLTDDTIIGAEQFDLLIRQLHLSQRDFLEIVRREFKKKEKDTKKLPKPFTRKDVEDALVLLLQKAIDFTLEQVRISLKCPAENLAPLINWIRASTGKEDRSDVAAIAHWLWLIKRKLLGLPVANHIMVVAYGKQGGGKTIAIRKLLGPLHDFGYVLYASVSQIADERYLKLLNEHFVVFCDEMAWAERADINSLKNTISADILTPRKLGTNQGFRIKQNSTFIGASNRRVNEMIWDSSGMRRFYELICEDTLSWSLVNSIDYLELIRGIDEARKDGYLIGDALATVRKKQDELINRDDLTLFLEDECLLRDDASSNPQYTTNHEIWTRFKVWNERNGVFKYCTSKDLYKRLRNRGFISHMTKDENGTTSRGFFAKFSNDAKSRPKTTLESLSAHERRAL